VACRVLLLRATCRAPSCTLRRVFPRPGPRSVDTDVHVACVSNAEAREVQAAACSSVQQRAAACSSVQQHSRPCVLSSSSAYRTALAPYRQFARQARQARLISFFVSFHLVSCLPPSLFTQHSPPSAHSDCSSTSSSQTGTYSHARSPACTGCSTASAA
jgi:hypothetical protein